MRTVILVPLLSAALVACGGDKVPVNQTSDTGPANVATPDTGGPLTVYCGRSKTLVRTIFEDFTKATGIAVNVRYGKTTALANTLLEEADKSPADLFFAQDAGGLGVVAAAGLLAKLRKSTLDRVDPRFRDTAGDWVGVSGRARVVAYNTDRLKAEDLPDTMQGFTDPRWRGRIGWPTSNASFHAFVTAMRRLDGDKQTSAWLNAIQANEPKVYPKNTPAVRAVATGEVDVAFVNHYYRHRLAAEAGDKPFPVQNYHPRGGGAGALLNIAGVGILKSSKHPAAAEKLVNYLLSKPAQQHFATKNFEYPLTQGVPAVGDLPPLAALKLPRLPLGELQDLQATMKLLRATKVLP